MLCSVCSIVYITVVYIVILFFLIMRRTKIIATVGPASQDYEILKELATIGVDIFRLNLSHNSQDSVKNIVDKINQINEEIASDCAVSIDTKGSQIRTAQLDSPIHLNAGSSLILTSDNVPYEGVKKLYINYPKLSSAVNSNDKILLDNGMIILTVIEVQGNDVMCKVENDGIIDSERHVNITNKRLEDFEVITENDVEDIKNAIDLGVQFITISFTSSSEDILKVRKIISNELSHVKIIAKIERIEAIENIVDIVKESDGIMIARGDLGCELDIEKLPVLQSKIVTLCRSEGKPVIIATQILDSMRNNIMPTRAEVTDIANAVSQQVDAVMLSNETAIGKYPVETLKMLIKVIEEVEEHIILGNDLKEINSPIEDFANIAARIASDAPSVVALVIVSKNIETILAVSAARTSVPALVFTDNQYLGKITNMMWGIKTLPADLSRDNETVCNYIEEEMDKNYPHWRNKRYIILIDRADINEKSIPILQIRTLSQQT